MDNPKPIRITVFDDNAERRKSLEYLLRMNSDMLLAGSYPDAQKAVENVAISRPDIVLMDIEMPGVNGIDAVKQLKSANPFITIIMQTVFDDEDMVFSAIEAGASGYLLKNTPPPKILESIREAHSGGAPMTPSIAMKVLRYFQTKTVPKNDYQLTEREKDILELLVGGNSYKMAAAALHISYHTVNSHVRHIYEKLHVNSLGEAVSKALKEKLV